MPRLRRCFIRGSLFYLAFGFTFGALRLANEGLAFDPHRGNLLPVHMELLLVGWMLQLALGVAYTILPRYGKGLSSRIETLAWLSGILLAVKKMIFNVACFMSREGYLKLPVFWHFYWWQGGE